MVSEGGGDEVGGGYVSSACRIELHDDCPVLTIRCACHCHRVGAMDAEGSQGD